MKSKLIYRDANIGDIEDIVRVIRDGNKDQLDKIIYGQKGIYNYIKKRILDKNLKFIYKVVEYERIPIAAMEIRILNEDTIFLNYISIEEDMRCRGIGTFMIKNLLYEYMNNSNIKYLELDVFHDNKKAYEWYLKMGLDIKSTNIWMILDVDDDFNNVDEVDEPSYIYSEKYSRDGFDIIDLNYNNKKYNIGLMGKNWFRIYEDDIDEYILKYLCSIKGRRVMSIVRSNSIINEKYIKTETINVSHRMKASIKSLIQNMKVR